MKKLSSIGAAGATALIAGVVAAPALAASGSRAQAGAPRTIAAPGVDAASPAGKSPDFAGYAYPLLEGSLKVSTTIKAPMVKCTAQEPVRAIASGVFVNNTKKKDFSFAGLFVGCQNGKASLFPVLVVDGKEKNYRADRVAPGDTVKVQVSRSASRVVVSLVDKAHKIKLRRHGAGFTADVAPLLGDDYWKAKGRAAGVPHFGTLNFSHSLLNGSPFGKSSAATRYDRVNKKGTLQIETTAFAKNHESFKTIFKHS